MAGDGTAEPDGGAARSPLRVRQDGLLVGPAGKKRHHLLAFLAVRANRMVPVSELVDGSDGGPTTRRHPQSTWCRALRLRLEACA